MADFGYDEYGAPFLFPETTSPMKKHEEIELVKSAQRGDESAMLILLEKYERLCHKLARKFSFTASNHDHDDLVQEGRIGIMKGVQTYEEGHGTAPLTWFYYHCRSFHCNRSDFSRAFLLKDGHDPKEEGSTVLYYCYKKVNST
jgi:hypothetical protein